MITRILGAFTHTDTHLYTFSQCPWCFHPHRRTPVHFPTMSLVLSPTQTHTCTLSHNVLGAFTHTDAHLHTFSQCPWCFHPHRRTPVHFPTMSLVLSPTQTHTCTLSHNVKSWQNPDHQDPQAESNPTKGAQDQGNLRN